MEQQMNTNIESNGSEKKMSSTGKKILIAICAILGVLIGIGLVMSEEENGNAPYGRTFGITPNEVVHKLNEVTSKINIEKCDKTEKGEIEGYEVTAYSYMLTDTMGFQLIANEDNEVYEVQWIYDESSEDINEMLAYTVLLCKVITQGNPSEDEIMDMFLAVDNGSGPQYFDGIGVSMTSENGVGNFYFIALDSEETFNEYINKR